MDYEEINKSAQKNSEEIFNLIPNFMQAISQASDLLSESTTTDSKQRELIFLAFSIAKQCDACIATHTQAYVDVGGDRDSLGDLAAIAVLMQGGPGLTYAGKVVEAFDQLSN